MKVQLFVLFESVDEQQESCLLMSQRMMTHIRKVRQHKAKQISSSAAAVRRVWGKSIDRFDQICVSKREAWAFVRDLRGRSKYSDETFES